MKKILAGLMLGAVLVMGQQVTTSNVVSAAPFITLDYGSKYVWVIDKGSTKYVDGNYIVNMDEETRVGKTAVSGRKYRFTQENGTWYFRYESWTGKGGYEGMTSKRKVADNQLANDILYIILN